MPEEKERRLRGPVRWLLDRQLLVNLREIVLYSAFGTRIDPRSWMAGLEVDLTDDFEGEEFWFDYLSDTGDGMKATYSIAYLAYSDLWVSSVVQPTRAVAFGRGESTTQRLPRGAFLLIGGDTAYHVADYETLAERFHYPFNRAFRHLAKLGKVDTKKRRPLFGIPGNHDYYDFLDGFNRQFRRPYNDERRYDEEKGGDQPQLVLEGFARKQRASYFSLKLPFGWRLWGMDAQDGVMDRRQRNFFHENRKEKPTDRLIIATPEPITAFGQRADPDSAIVRSLKDLELPLPFLEKDPEKALPAGSCRLDIAGDVHHYARYWGSEPGDPEPARYASVVSGLGGAFLHSSSTDVGEVRAKHRYPEPKKALAETLRRLLNPALILFGGRIGVIGMLVAGLLYLAASSAPSLQEAVKPLMESADLTFPVPSNPPDLVGEAVQALQTSLNIKRIPRPEMKPARWVDWELAYLPILLLLVAGITAWNSRLAARARRGETTPDSAYSGSILLLALAFLGTRYWVYFLHDAGFGAFHPLTSDFAVLAMLAVSFLCLWWCRQYDDALNGKVRRTGSLSWMDWLQLSILWGFTVLSGVFGIARYGYYPLAVSAVDIVFLVIVLSILIGLPVFAWKAGAHLYRLPGKIGFLLLGLVHAILQLSVPVVLVVSCGPKFGGFAALATVAFTLVVGQLVPYLLRRSRAQERYLVGTLLLVLWLAWSGGLMAFAWLNRSPQVVDVWSFALALGLGAILSCTWLGWYLAVSLCFDGHNNEAGGGARIERFKQLIRFRLNQDGLTGYVIAIDEPKADGKDLQPRVIDVFELRPGQP
jgi:hypothetical protein